jgi:pimeloyl-ACP methyl ester carboxylesterase
MKAFGEDVQAVIEAVGSQNVILIGHSMGGAVIAEAARLMPERVKGLIGIDSLENIEYPLKHEDFEAMMIPFKNDFQSGTRQFVQSMLSSNSDTRIKEWILSDMAAAPASIALSAMEEYLPRYITGLAAKVFETIKVPVVTVNSDMWPINYEGNRRHMQSFEAIVVKNSDHFLMLNRPKAFNDALKKAIAITLKN